MALVDNGAILCAISLMNDTPTFFNNANARIGVGDSTTAWAQGQTDLQAAVNKLRKGMDTTFPTRASGALTFRSTFATGEANWVWNEWSVFNAASGATSMLNRKVESLGTKTSAQSWELTVTLTLSAV